MDRDTVLNKLLSENLITQSQYTTLLEWSKPGDTQDIILGYVKGLGGVVAPPKDIARVLGMTVDEVNATEKRNAPPSVAGGAVGEFFEAREGRTDEELAAGQQQNESREAFQARIDKAVVDAELAIDQAFGNGDIDEDHANALKSKLNKQMGYPKYGDLHLKKIGKVLEEVLGYEGVDETTRADVQAATGAAPVDHATDESHQYLPGSERARLEEERGAWTPIASEAQLSPSTWDDMLDQAGLISVGEDGSVQRAPEAAHIGPGWFVDPATGQVYSQAEVDSYRDDIVRATTAGVDPNVAGSAAARLEEAIATPYYRKPDLMTGQAGAGAYGRAGTALRVSGRDPSTGATTPGKAYMPAEDLQIPTLLPDDPWEIPLYDYQTGQAQFMWANMSIEERERWTADMLKNGSLDPDEVSAGTINATTPYAMPQIEVLERAMYQSVYHQVNLREGLKIDGAEVARIRAAQGRADAVARAFSVPASLREIPGDKTLAQEAKDRFSRVLGRNVLDDELTGLVGELKGYYEDSTQEKIALSLAAFNGDNQGLLTGAQLQQIENPGEATSFDIEEKWASEIDLNNRRESNADSFSRILNATMGGQVSVANRTAAGGVSQIAR